MQLPPFKLERYFAQYEFSVRYLLCSSDCESVSVRDVLAASPGSAERLQECWLGYTESQGSPSLREAITALYTTIQPEHVLVHSGAEEVIFLCMHALLKAGDHVIVQTPCYQSLFAIAEAIGCEVTHWQGQAEDGWSWDLDELASAIRPQTRLIVVNAPHNPTGWLPTQQQYRDLVSLADRHGIVLFSDEVYRESEYDSADRLPAGCDLSEHAISLGVMSKTYGMAGLRIGWAATRNRALYERMAQLKDYTTICNSAPSELLSELVLRQREQFVARNTGIIRKNLALLDSFFAEHAEYFDWKRPKAGPIAFPRLRNGDIEHFCLELVTQNGVLLLPGTMYDITSNHFRIGFGRLNMPEALEQLASFLRATHPKVIR